MKIPTLLTAVALTCGVAFTAQANTGADQQKQSTAASSTHAQAKGEGLGTKTKRAFHRVGDKLRSIGNKDKTQSARNDDTQTMGAGPAQDSGRRQRMDDAYANWKSKQKQ
jgi:hypothetical protein